MKYSDELPIGKKSGRWTVVSGRVKHGGRSAYPCRCDCGTERAVLQDALRREQSLSCGCARPVSTWCIHGMSGTAEYRAWRSMRDRCERKNNGRYSDYGGRGIQVCERWHKFENFVADMGIKPSPRHSLDRIDNDGNYELGNCRWASPVEQSRNKRPGSARSPSGVVGVTPARGGRWMSRIGVGDSVVYLGTFDTVPEAAEARRRAQADLW